MNLQHVEEEENLDVKEKMTMNTLKEFHLLIWIHGENGQMPLSKKKSSILPLKLIREMPLL